jgi:hypothetical protein
MALKVIRGLRKVHARHAGHKKLRLKALRKKPRRLQSDARVRVDEEDEEKDRQVQQDSVILCKESIGITREILSGIGFRDYLEDSVVGLSKSSDVCAFSLLSNARFLLWTHLSINQTPLELSNYGVRHWTQMVVKYHANAQFTFQSYLLNNLKFKPDSVISFASCLKEYVEWFHTFRTVAHPDPFKIKLSSYHKFMMTNKRVMKGARKLRIKEVKKRSGSQTNALDEAIANRQLPQGGLKELQDTVSAEMPWVYSFCTSVRRGPGLVDEPTYQRLICLLIASMYVFAPQGRISGIEDMKVKHVPELMKSFATSEEFKTSDHYGYQAVSMGNVSKEILSLYMKYFRPRVVSSRPTPNDVLFLTFQGTPDRRLGRHVTAFFKLRLGIHITTTLIRVLVETTVEEKYRSGEITLDQREAMSVISGHSSKIVKDHYLRLNVAEQLEKAKVAMGMSDAEPAPTNEPKMPVKLKDWGTAHPQYNCGPHDRIKYSEEEDAYLLDLAQDMMRSDGTLPERFTSLALKAIKEDPNATAIFHLKHIFSADRLRSRYRFHKLTM